MARGPLPNPNARRRNTPTISTTSLPAAGRQGTAPDPPRSCTLAAAGREWWDWAWSTPQATRWGSGSLYTVARRAQLEDDLATLELVDHLDMDDLLDGADDDAIQRVEFALSVLKRSATGSVALMKEMREIDGKLGLNPKALADLRWVVTDEEPKAAEKPKQTRRLHAVDSATG